MVAGKFRCLTKASVFVYLQLLIEQLLQATVSHDYLYPTFPTSVLIATSDKLFQVTDHLFCLGCFMSSGLIIPYLIDPSPVFPSTTSDPVYRLRRISMYLHKNGMRSGVTKTFNGQPPLLSYRLYRIHIHMIYVRMFFTIYFHMLTKCSFMYFAVPSSSKLSRSIT